MALIKERLGAETVVTPGQTGQFEVLADGERVAERGGNWFTRSFGARAFIPDLDQWSDQQVGATHLAAISRKERFSSAALPLCNRRKRLRIQACPAHLARHRSLPATSGLSRYRASRFRHRESASAWRLLLQTPLWLPRELHGVPLRPALVWPVLPVPIAQTGSYATVMGMASPPEISRKATLYCRRRISSVTPASRSARTSPTQTIGFNPMASAARSFGD